MTITGDYLFIGLITLGFCLTLFASKRPSLPLALAAGLIWFSTGIWLWFSSTPIFGFSETWSQMLAFVFVIMTFVPFLLQMNVEVRYEQSKQGKFQGYPGAESSSYVAWGPKPGKKVETSEDRQAAHREQLKGISSKYSDSTRRRR
jgi:hypothetical protein